MLSRAQARQQRASAPTWARTTLQQRQETAASEDGRREELAAAAAAVQRAPLEEGSSMGRLARVQKGPRTRESLRRVRPPLAPAQLGSLQRQEARDAAARGAGAQQAASWAEAEQRKELGAQQAASWAEAGQREEWEPRFGAAQVALGEQGHPLPQARLRQCPRSGTAAEGGQPAAVAQAAWAPLL